MINVKENLNIETRDYDTIIKERDEDIRSAFERLDRLKLSLETLKVAINETDVANTSDAWHKAYETLTKAFKDCMKEEKKIIMKW
jgi:hypothetical protein